MADDSSGILSDAIARNLATVLSLPSAGMLRHHKSRFLEECEEGFWIESAPQDSALIDDLIARAHPAAITFKLGTGKASFAAVPIKRNPEFQINEQTVVDALLIQRPSEIKTVQRRTNYRAPVTADSEMTVRMWRLSEQADYLAMPLSQQELLVKFRDLSIGGMGVTVLSTPESPAKLLADERVRIELKAQDQTLVLEGRVRHLVPTVAGSNDSLRAGIQFKKLQEDLSGRQTTATLTRIVGHLQREQVRRMRLGLTKTN